MWDHGRIAELREEVARRWAVDRSTVRVVFAPYRICPLGAHIDHQLGQVTAMALDRGVLLAFAPLPQAEARMASFAFPGDVGFSLAAVPPRQSGDWGNFLRGAVCALRQHYSLPRGIAGITAGDAGEGGLSSSAAVGVAYLLALEAANGLTLPPEANIALDQYIENEYLGLRNGVLDQAAILLSRRRQLTFIDCAEMRHEHWPQPARMPEFAILIAFSGIRQALVATDYNRRVAECQEAARVLLEALGRSPEPAVLRRVATEEYLRHRERLSGPAARRAAHFFAEMERVQRGIQAWRAGDLAWFGRLICESGESSIVNYQCGAPPLIELYRLLQDTNGVYGARFSGAGFRGCCLALVDTVQAAAAADRITSVYRQRYPELACEPQVVICESADGARLLDL